jgi:hypothetical protein
VYRSLPTLNSLISEVAKNMRVKNFSPVITVISKNIKRKLLFDVFYGMHNRRRPFTKNRTSLGPRRSNVDHGQSINVLSHGLAATVRHSISFKVSRCLYVPDTFLNRNLFPKTSALSERSSLASFPRLQYPINRRGAN